MAKLADCVVQVLCILNDLGSSWSIDYCECSDEVSVIVEIVYFIQFYHLFFRKRFWTSHTVILNSCLCIAIVNDILKTYRIVEIVFLNNSC